MSIFQPTSRWWIGFPPVSARHAALSKLMDDGRISPENMGENWLWLKSTIDRIEMSKHEMMVAELERIIDDDE